MVGRTHAPPVGRPYQVPGRTTRAVSRRDAGDLPYAWAVPSPDPSRVALLLALVALSLAACAATAAASFDPTGPCTADGSAPGAYPDLEAMVPATYEGRAPDTLDSGPQLHGREPRRACADAGIDEVRFAGGTWGFGGNRAAALCRVQRPGPDGRRAWPTSTPRAPVRRTGPRSPASRRRRSPADRATASTPTTGERQQTVVVWPAAEPDVVNVVITNDLPDPKIEAAVAAFGGR